MESILPLLSFAFAATVTPGPSNLMLAASGVAFGFRRTLRHMLGIPAGFVVLIVVCGLGAGALVRNMPAAGLGLKLLGTAYLVYLTWCMRRAFSAHAGAAAGRPLGFVEAALFQFANPKAWLVALTAVTAFAPAGPSLLGGLLGIGGAFLLVMAPCLALWVGIGVTARRSLVSERMRPIFGAAIIGLMLYSIVGIWLQE